MSSTLSHTSLESLLIFQSVATQDTTLPAFDSISNYLNQNEFIRSQERYDATRLGPAEIETAYKSLLADEARTKKEQRANRPNGFLETTEPNSRKRKLSPSVSPTPEDVEKNVEWMADLASRLYAKYKQNVVAEIKHEEGQYRAITEEIRKIEAEAEQHVADGPASSQPSQRVPDVDITEEPAKDEKEVVANGPSANKPASPIKAPQTIEIPKDLTTGPKVSQNKDQDQQIVDTEKPGTTSSGPTIPSVSPTQQHPPLLPILPAQSTPGPRNLPSPAPPPSTGSVSPAVPSNQTPQPQTFQNGASGRRPSAPPLQPPQQTRFSPIQSQPHSPVILPPPLGMPPPQISPMRPPSEVSTASRRGSRTPNPPQPPPYMPPQQPYPQHQPYGYPSWQGQPAPQQSHPHLSPYGSPYPPQSIQGGRGYPPSATHPYPPYGQQSPVQFALPQTLNSGLSRGSQPPYQLSQQNPQPGWPVATPLTPRRAPSTPQTGIFKSNSPWRSDPKFIKTQMPQPTREREVSPIEERVEWLQQIARKAQEKNLNQSTRTAPTPVTPVAPKEEKLQPTSAEPTSKSVRGGRRGRRGRAASAASSAVGDRSRSQSVTSYASETRQGDIAARRVGVHAIKPEPPTTPVALPSDSEPQRSTRQRGNTLQSLPDTVSRTIGRSRRGLRDSEDSSVPPPVTPRTAPQPRQPADANMVTTTRNFSKISQTLMNEVIGHKHAGIFAKPITEREAPGYKKLVYRPQDLKSIKAAITAGNKAVLAAMEDQSAASGTTSGAGEASSPTATPIAAAFSTPMALGAAGSGKSLSSSAVLLLKKTPDFAPPRAIVNSSQLEKELIRMFANAIMFNPLPREERGFGNIRLGPGGVVDPVDEDPEIANDDIPAPADGAPSKRTWQTEEGGIIRDTREMAEAVERAVGEWKGVEQATTATATATVGMGMGMGGSFGGGGGDGSVKRGGSMSVSVAASEPAVGAEREVEGEESVKGDEAEGDKEKDRDEEESRGIGGGAGGGGDGRRRKRRKVGD